MGLATIIRKEKVKQGEYRILILGLDNAGKSSVLDRWLHNDSGEERRISPTFGFEIKTVILSSHQKLNFWDIGGQKSIRPFWRNYYEETDAIVWVIDSADVSRLSDCRKELESVLNADRLTGTSLLILANKQDCLGAISLEGVRDALGLNQLDHTHHHWAVFATSARNGLHIKESLNWLGREVYHARFGIPKDLD